jgi:hypothetical protein
MDFTLVVKRFAAALLLALPLAAAAQEDPELVYSRLHKAMLAANLSEMLKYASAAQRKELDAIPQAQKSATVQLMAKMLPASYSVADTTINPDGKSAELRATGMATGLMGGKPETNYGVVRLVKEGNAWKVDKTEWSNQQPAGFRLVQAPPKPVAVTPAPASAASTPAAAPLKEEDVQANEEGMSKARKEEEAVMRKKAAEDAAAERQRQHEARMALCVIRPVMTDPEIDFCKAAYRD